MRTHFRSPKHKPKELEFCDHCILRKATQQTFNDYILLSEQRANLITYKEAMNVYMLKSKALRFFAKFVKWKNLIEIQIEKKIKKLRIDKRLEFVNEKFQQIW